MSRAMCTSDASRHKPALGLPVTDQLRQTLKNLLRRKKDSVPILYQIPAFGAFDDFSDFLESISCETSKSCQVRGSNPCRGASTLDSITYKIAARSLYEFCT